MLTYLITILRSIPKKAGYKKFLGKDYDEFMETFAEVYRKFIKEGDPVLELQQFKTIFDKIMTDSLNKELEKSKKIVIDEGIFQTVIIKSENDDIMTFSYCLN